MYSINLDENGRILSATLKEYDVKGVIVPELPQGDITEYIYQNGAYIFSPLPQPFQAKTKAQQIHDGWLEVFGVEYSTDEEFRVNNRGISNPQDEQYLKYRAFVDGIREAL